MSLRPCLAKLSLSFWASRQRVRPPVFSVRHVEQRFIGTRTLPAELQNALNKGILKQLKSHHDELKVAIEKRNIDELCFNLSSSRRLFFTLPKLAWRLVRDSHLQLNKTELEEIVRILARRSRKEDAETLGQLLRDVKAMYGVEPTSELLLETLNSLVRASQQLQAYDLLMLFNNYKVKPFRLNLQHWRITMRGLAQIGDVERLKECLGIMKKNLPFPGTPHYQALLEGVYRRQEPPSRDEVRQILDEIQQFNFPYDAAICEVLVRIANKYGFDSFPTDYKERSASRARRTDSQEEEWAKQLVPYRRKGKFAFESRLISLCREGFVPNERSLIKLVQVLVVSSPDELIYLQEVLGLPPKTISWSICIRNILEKEKGGWQNGFAALEVAKSQGVKPDAAMLHPLLRAMCRKLSWGPPESALDKALNLYQDLSEEAKSSGKPGADTPLFNTLLRALAANKDKQKYFPIALSLLEDMRSQGVMMDRMTGTSVAVLLVRSSSTYEEAAQAYRQARSINSEGLDQKGYEAVLHAFCSLEPEGASLQTDTNTDTGTETNEAAGNIKAKAPPIPPAILYFEILQDMYAHGFRKSPQVYTVLLGRYAALATLARSIRSPERRDAVIALLRTVIKETHRQISVDAGLVIDAPLLNQLMDTYNRAGLFRDVLHVWSMLNSTGLVTPASISIVFDTCGYHKQSHQADVIMGDLKERGFRLNRRNWNSWVECLCRLGRLDEALRAVCSDMKNSGNPEGRPDEQTVQILLSFASAHGRLQEVKSYLDMHLPNHALGEIRRE